MQKFFLSIILLIFCFISVSVWYYTYTTYTTTYYAPIVRTVYVPVYVPSSLTLIEECQIQYWMYATIGSYWDTCACKEWYVWSSSKTYCEPKTVWNTCYDPANTYLGNDWNCYCNYWYVFDSNQKICISRTQSCQKQYWTYAMVGSTPNTCTCQAWYIWDSSKTYCMSAIPTLTPTQICQKQYWYNSYSNWNSCSCNDGYAWNSNSTSCILPLQACHEIDWINSYAASIANADGSYNCYCNDGYLWNANQKSCVKATTASCQSTYGYNSSLSWNSCSCNNGYVWNSDWTSCVKATTASCQSTYGYNSSLSWNSCSCNNGYVWNSDWTSCIKATTTSCQSTYGYNSSLSWNDCYCNDGYVWNSDWKSCVKATTTSCQSTYGYNSSLSWNNCSCKEGYIWNNDWTSCILWTNINTGTTEDINTGSNVISGSELSDAILWMYNNWLTNYSSVTDFMWNSYLTREQATKFFVKFDNRLWNNDTANIKNRFVDIKNATPDLIPYISNAYSMGIMNWKNNRFMPFDNLTQAQAIAVIVRMINWQENENGPLWYNEYYNIVSNTWKILDGLWFDYSTLDSTNILRSDMALLLYRASKW